MHYYTNSDLSDTHFMYGDANRNGAVAQRCTGSDLRRCSFRITKHSNVFSGSCVGLDLFMLSAVMWAIEHITKFLQWKKQYYGRNVVDEYITESTKTIESALDMSSSTILRTLNQE